MSLVLDPSLALSWYFEDERTAEADALLDQVVDRGAVVPSLWRLEVANGFQSAIRRNRIDSDTDGNAWTATVRLSDRFKLTAYHAAYLELAQRRRLPLASLDQPLCRAAISLGLTVLGYTAG